jgi:hypothetical protein
MGAARFIWNCAAMAKWWTPCPGLAGPNSGLLDFSAMQSILESRKA